jgi:hypothetical protein
MREKLSFVAIALGLAANSNALICTAHPSCPCQVYAAQMVERGNAEQASEDYPTV